MQRDYWHRQTSDKPLFPDLLWSRPENRAHAGKLLIVGGNEHGFVAPAEAFKAAEKAGAGTVRMVLPDSVRRYVGKVFTAGELAPTTPSGSFSQEALATLLSEAEWADASMLAGDFGRNSETAILLEKFAGKYEGQLTIAQDAADYFIGAPAALLARPKTLLVISFAQLQKLAVNAKFTRAFTFDMNFLHLIDTLREFTTEHQTHIVTKHLETLFVAVNGQVSTTKLDEDMKIWRIRTAAATAVWWLQNPSKPFEAITTACSGHS